MKISPVVLALAWLCAPALPAPGVEPDQIPAKTGPQQIEFTVTPDKAAIMQGEALYLTLTLRNISAHPLAVELSLLYTDRDTLEGFNKLSAVEKNGAPLPKSHWDEVPFRQPPMDKPGREQVIPPGGNVSFRIFAPRWITFAHPGSYTLTATSRFYFRNKAKDFHDGGLIKGEDEVSVTASTDVTVVADDPGEIGKIIDALVAKAAGKDDSQPVREARRMLEAMPDARVIPWLAQEMKNPQPQRQEDASYALARSSPDAALDVLKQALATATTDFTRELVCHALVYSPNPAAAVYLKTLVDDSNGIVSWYARVMAGFEFTLVPEKPSIMPGEPISATLIVTNNTGREVTMAYFHGDLERDSGLSSQIELTATDQAGVKAPAAPPNLASRRVVSIGGPDYIPQIPAGGKNEMRLWIPWRIAFDHPGSYTLTATATFPFYDQGLRDMLPIHAHVTAPLEVLPVDDEKMGQYIAGLAQNAALSRAMRPGDGTQDYEISLLWAKKLDAIHDVRVIPYYLKEMQGAKYTDWIEAMNALAKFNDDRALGALKQGMEVATIVNPVSHKPDPDALARVHLCACRALYASRHPGAIPYLVAQRKNPDEQVRMEALHAAACKLPAKEAIPILEEMQKSDPKKWVRDTAKSDLQWIKAGKPAQDGGDGEDEEEEGANISGDT